MASWDDVRRIALALPETTEKAMWGTPSWRVKDKLFVWDRPLRGSDLKVLGDAAPAGPILGVRVEHLGVKEALIGDDPAVFFTIPHFDGYPAVLVLLELIPLDELEELIVEAWLCRAPKRLAKAFLDAQPDPARRMTAVTLVGAGQGEVIGDAPDRRVEILSDDPSLNATWSRFAPGRDGADLHVHHHHADHFFVLEGELTVRLGPGGDHVAVPAGALARIPPDVVHGFRNTSDAEVRFLNLHAPGCGFADYMRAMRAGRTLAYDQHAPPPDGGRPTTEAVFAAGGPATGEPGVLADHDEIAVATTACDGQPQTRVHPGHVASLYVLGGELALSAGGEELRAGPGAWLQIPAGVPHRLSGPASLVDIRTPA